ncbi:hypothetical protein HY989_03330 [Candidatus Micrarchaeota archaeon]|nr:hypothetical protein [Candidatus Micrarchaeota archaeon]
MGDWEISKNCKNEGDCCNDDSEGNGCGHGHCGEGNCGNGGCGEGNECAKYECSSVDYAEMIANWARKEILKEKVKARMEKEYGKELDSLAGMIVEFVKDFEAQNLKDRKKADALEEKMDRVMGWEND